MHGKGSGFTVIELVVVIILLAILAATALPRFINVDDGTHAAAFAAMQNRLQAGISRYHAQWMDNAEAAPDAALAEFGALRANAAGFPYGTDDNSGSGSDIADADDCVAVLKNVVQAGGPTVAEAADLAGVPAAGTNVDYVALEKAGICTYHYTAGTANLGSELRTLTYNPANGQVTAGAVTLARHRQPAVAPAEL